MKNYGDRLLLRSVSIDLEAKLEYSRRVLNLVVCGHIEA